MEDKHIETAPTDGEISDGFHTFNELYEHRCTLFIALMKSYPKISWRANNHDDGSNFENWFIAGMKLPTGNISYHLPSKVWEALDGLGIETRLNAPKWDGHNSNDVVQRIKSWVPSV